MLVLFAPDAFNASELINCWLSSRINGMYIYISLYICEFVCELVVVVVVSMKRFVCKVFAKVIIYYKYLIESLLIASYSWFFFYFSGHTHGVKGKHCNETENIFQYCIHFSFWWWIHFWILVTANSIRQYNYCTLSKNQLLNFLIK